MSDSGATAVTTQLEIAELAKTLKTAIKNLLDAHEMIEEDIETHDVEPLDGDVVRAWIVEGFADESLRIIRNVGLRIMELRSHAVGGLTEHQQELWNAFGGRDA